LISGKMLEDMLNNMTQNRQDNVLVEYECALIQHKAKGIPVVPIFIGSIVNPNTKRKILFSQINNLTLPDVPHNRRGTMQAKIEHLSKTIEAGDKKFLNSISQTFVEIFKLQGIFLPKRAEDRGSIENMVHALMENLEGRSSMSNVVLNHFSKQSRTSSRSSSRMSSSPKKENIR